MMIESKDKTEKTKKDVEKKTTVEFSLTRPLDEETIKTLHAEKKIYVAARSAKLQLGIAEKIITDTTETANLDNPQQALVLIAMLFQQGGTARSCDGNMVSTYQEKTLKLADVRKVLKSNSCNKAERKLARTLSDRIYEVAKVMEIPGNLYQKIQKKNLERKFEMEEKVWLSDFQSDNENCPIELRKLILESFKKITPEKKNKKKS